MFENASLWDLERRVGRRLTRCFSMGVLLGLLVAVVVHGLVFVLLGTQAIFGEPSRVEKRPTEVTWERVEEPEPPRRFIEANPEAPVREPPDEAPEAARDQRAAQPEPVDAEGAAAAVEGFDELGRVVAGAERRREPEGGVYGSAPADGDGEPSDRDGESVAPPPARPTSGPEFLREAVDEGDGVSVVSREEAEPEDAPRDGPETVRLDPVERMDAADRGTGGADAAPPQPRPRPRVPPDVIAGEQGTQDAAHRVGIVAVDARFSEFGEYQQRMFEAIVEQWHLLVRGVGYAAIESPSRVSIRFVLLPDGTIETTEIMDYSSNRLGAMLCLDAIQSRAPFGNWTPAMRAALGDETELWVRFHYR